MNAVTLRNLLIASIVLSLGGIGAIIYYASNYLQSEVTQTVHTRIKADLSQHDLDRLKSLEKVLKNNQASVEKAAQIVSDSQKYEYQDQIVSDINTYAIKTGVNVTGFDFGDAFAATAAKSNVQKTPTVTGVKSIVATLTLGSPMSYDNYLMFIKAIEKNLTKMQVAGINITPDEKSPGSISNPSVVLIVYVR
jgi:hypothetical protein